MRIFVLAPDYPSSYSLSRGIFFRDQAEALAALGADVTVLAVIPISFKDSVLRGRLDFKTSFYVRNGVKTFVKCFASVPKMRRLNERRSLARFLSLYRQVTATSGSPDVVHAQRYDATESAAAIRSRFGVPFVCTEHSTELCNSASWSASKLNQLKEQYSRASNRLAVSEPLSQHLAQQFGLSFDYLPNLVRTREFPLVDRITRDEFVFCTVGHLVPNKNQDLLLKAFATVASRHPNVRLSIAGGGVLRDKLSATAAAFGISNRVQFLGSIDRSSVVRLLQQSDCFVLSSKLETFGVVLIEAMSTGLPVVATRSGGPESVIKSDDVGILIDSGDEAQLVSAMERAMTSNWSSSRIHGYVEANFSSTAVGTKLLSYLEAACASS